MSENEHARHARTVMQLVGVGGAGLINSSQDNEFHPQIIRSWERCLTRHNLTPSSVSKPILLGEKSLRDYSEPLDDFLYFAQSGMQKLYKMLSAVGYVLMLSDANGVTIEYLGNPKDERENRKAGFCPGSVWLESLAGTCGVGTCIEDRRAVTVHREDHFSSSFMGLSCSAVPLYFPDGTLLGTLDASLLDSPESKDSQAVALLLLNSHARLIENSYFIRKCRDSWIIRFNSMQAFVEVSTENMVAVNSDGSIIAANYNALNQLIRQGGCSPINRQLSEVFEMGFEDLVTHALNTANMIFPIRVLNTGIQYFASFIAPDTRKNLPSGHQAASDRATSAKTRVQSSLSLTQLASSDMRMQQNVTCAKRVMNKGIPILLIGETGTGKEVFARAVHDASNRASRPFVALNCASIPESLIESELFGYKAGAFTGAHIKGMRGKILQADGGTLFLDEIGDMPLNLQTRMLRVLAEKEIVPLGCETPVKVDLNVICATLRNLEELVQRGDFREDLYYRLNGVTIVLPPLRERNDKEALIKNILAGESCNGELKLSAEALEALLRAPWPGNLRELRNVLRYAQAVNEGGIIGVEDLPAGYATLSAAPPAANVPEPQASPKTKSREAMHGAERLIILNVLTKQKWNIARASRELCISRPTLYKKMKQNDIVPPHKFDRRGP
ncbi:MAG: sigma-54-dependent Fis family transcriptional regulator [Deltaproteobacteria bacterium]|nr:sigma-54-dependent Fis family transcriptional regulator [Deltaproteobacteria bacterium]